MVTIREITGNHDWRHVRSDDNPADTVSRDQLPRDFLRNQTWFTGPTWLIKNENKWPDEVMQVNEISELKKNTCLTTMHSDMKIFEGFSSYSKLLRIIAYCLRFRITNKHIGPLSAREINEAEIRVLKILQTTRFADEIKRLESKVVTPLGKSKLANLNPFLDGDKLIRVGGRLQMSELTFTQRRPILLPPRHYLINRIIREVHEKYHHTGIQTTLYIIRQKF